MHNVCVCVCIGTHLYTRAHGLSVCVYICVYIPEFFCSGTLSRDADVPNEPLENEADAHFQSQPHYYDTAPLAAANLASNFPTYVLLCVFMCVFVCMCVLLCRCVCVYACVCM